MTHLVARDKVSVLAQLGERQQKAAATSQHLRDDLRRSVDP